MVFLVTEQELYDYISKPNWFRGVSISNGGIKKEVKDKLIELTSFLPEDKVNITARAWHLLNKNYEVQKCPICKNNLRWQPERKRYTEFCSIKCMANSDRVKKKISSTNIEKYGNSCSLLNADVREKIEKTLLEKYGTIYPSQNDDIKNKIAKTNLERYGTEKLLKNKSIRAKRFQTNLKKYGYGEHFANNDIKNKIINTNLSRYGYKWYIRHPLSNEKLMKLSDKDWLIEQHQKYMKPISQIANELSVDDTTVNKWFKKHDIELKNFFASSSENEIKTFIKNYDVRIKENDRTIITPYELDIFIPSHLLAIEYCGLYWHSDAHKKISASYHENKYQLCKNKNIKLITIFEDEWLNHKNIIKNKLLYFLKTYNAPKIYARKTDITTIDSQPKRDFFDQFHIQGNGPSSLNYGLFYNDELVAVIGFIKNNDNSFTLNRYATSTTVVGGFSKLLTYFEKEYNFPKIITFADLRWSNGDLYYKTGFKFDKLLRRDYYWTKGGIRYHKFNFRHSSMKKKLKEYDEKLSEAENMYNNGYYKIWDCGKIRFVKNG